MELKKIKYRSAIFFGVFALVIYLIFGILQLVVIKNFLYQIPEYSLMAAQITPLQVLVYTPIIGGLVAYAITMLAIFVYNQVARKFPISWEMGKK